ncbi:MAG TPA: GatB/YqeY domain-containing protein [Ktedonobacterales bacterium]|nr:GatB/YqeY domain-containing protein [Ktedonobacterales bacterium]
MSETKTTASPIEKRMREDLKIASRERDQLRMDTIRMALDAFHLEEIARMRQAITEEDRVKILDKQIRQREEALEIYRGARRQDMIDKEERQAEILRAYMPARLSDDEIRALVSQLIATHGKDFRTIMPLASRETKGHADGKHVQEIVRELTA